MVIGIFGESCTGKSTAAEKLGARLNARVYSGKDYLRAAKAEDEAKKLFAAMLAEHERSDESIIYVISEKQQLALLPPNAVRVLMTEDLETITERFARRMNGNMPAPVTAMLRNKHGMFDAEACDIRLIPSKSTPEDVCDAIERCCALKAKSPSPRN